MSLSKKAHSNWLVENEVSVLSSVSGCTTKVFALINSSQVKSIESPVCLPGECDSPHNDEGIILTEEIIKWWFIWSQWISKFTLVSFINKCFSSGEMILQPLKFVNHLTELLSECLCANFVDFANERRFIMITLTSWCGKRALSILRRTPSPVCTLFTRGYEWCNWIVFHLMRKISATWKINE